jgi:hypothetical protein
MQILLDCSSNECTSWNISRHFIHLFQRGKVVVEGLDFILSHIEGPIWPRTISTKTTEGRQVSVCNKEEALARYEQANYLDCRINAYPGYTQWNGTNRQASNLTLIDMDLSHFKSIEALDMALKKTLKNIRDKLDNAQPSVI